MAHQVVVGAGPVGRGVALELAARGDTVAVVTRRGTGPDHPAVTRVAADAGDVDALTRTADRAATLFNCANPPYHRWPQEWPRLHKSMMTAAERTGAVLAMTDNLYAFGPGTTMPMRATDPMRATGSKGAVRARMADDLLAAHAAGKLRATLVRASDYYGPEVLDSMMGERVMPKIVAGRRVGLLGSLDTPHSFSYMPDVVHTLVTAGTDSRAWGAAWHVPNSPAVTQREFIAAHAAAASTSVAVRLLPGWLLVALGTFSPTLRELRETRYQWTEPFVADDSVTRATFELGATPLAEGAAATVAWWRARG